MFFMMIAAIFYDLKGVKISVVIPFLFGVYFFISKPNTRLLIKSSKWILLSIAMLTVYYLLGYGDNQKTLQLLLAFILPLGVFIIAFYTGLNNRQELMRVFLKFLFVAAIFSLIPFVGRGLMGGEISKKLAHEVYSTDTSLIIFWPFLFLTMTFAFSFINFNDGRSKKFFLILFVILILSIFVSAFTAALVLMVLTFIGYYYIIASRKNFFKMAISGFVALTTILIGFNLIGKGYFGDLGGSAGKINAFLMFFQTTNTFSQQDLLKTATSGRSEIYEISIRSFLNSPVFGLGFSWEIINPISSQHSSILDNFAYFGVFSITILMIYLKFIFNSFKLCKLSKQKVELQKNGVIFGLLLAFLILNFFNPYFNYQMINSIIFFIGGWVSGNLEYKEKGIFI